MRAMSAYLSYAFIEKLDAAVFLDLFDSTEREIMNVYTEAVGGDLTL